MPNLFQQYQDYVVPAETQKKLNQPLLKADKLGKKHETFLETLVQKLGNGELDPMRPRSLFNHAVYDQLSEEEQEATDLTAINLMSIIKQIEVLWNLDHKQTFQLQNLVDQVFQMKSKFEEKNGDVFII